MSNQQESQKMKFGEIILSSIKDMNGNISSARIMEFISIGFAAALVVLTIIKYSITGVKPDYQFEILTFTGIATGLKLLDRITKQ